MTWVVDKGLDKLLAQINDAAPGRSKASDGSIGDEAHQGTISDHNPESIPGNPANQVDARDFTHDSNHGADMGVVSESIRQSKDVRVSYVIFNRRIYSGADGPQPWVWRPYSGDSPHTEHMHVSVRDDTHDQTQDWSIGLMTYEQKDRDWLYQTNQYLEAFYEDREYADFTLRNETQHIPNVVGARLERIEKTVEHIESVLEGLTVSVTLPPEQLAELATLVASHLQGLTFLATPPTGS